MDKYIQVKLIPSLIPRFKSIINGKIYKVVEIGNYWYNKYSIINESGNLCKYADSHFVPSSLLLYLIQEKGKNKNNG